MSEYSHAMLRSVVLHDIDMDHVAAMEKWYWLHHSPEITRRFGPWEVRHDSYLPVDVPPEARAFGFYNWRLTEGWWREIPKFGPQGELSFTPPPIYPEVAACFIPWQPTNDFKGWQVKPADKNVLRWFVMHRYPEGVSLEEGEDWFLNTHVPEVCQQRGLYRYFSSLTVPVKGGLPGTWAPGTEPPQGSVHVGWARVSELWYDNFADWRDSVIENPPEYTKPNWALSDQYPFMEPGKDFLSTFVLERPTDEFLRDARSYI